MGEADFVLGLENLSWMVGQTSGQLLAAAIVLAVVQAFWGLYLVAQPQVPTLRVCCWWLAGAHVTAGCAILGAIVLVVESIGRAGW